MLDELCMKMEGADTFEPNSSVLCVVIYFNVPRSLSQGGVISQLTGFEKKKA
jgi:hypothetical protein